MTGAARLRVVEAAMGLFGRQGFRATTVAQIERAAGLSAGAGGLYRHFTSKVQLLREGLTGQIESRSELEEFLDPGAVPPGGDVTAQLITVARAGLRRLEHERDLNRLLLRDLAAFPDLLALVRDRELRTVHAALTRWLSTVPVGADTDVPALAAVLMGAVSHFWIMTDTFSGEHPLDIDEDRYLASLASLASGVVRTDARS